MAGEWSNCSRGSACFLPLLQGKAGTILHRYVIHLFDLLFLHSKTLHPLIICTVAHSDTGLAHSARTGPRTVGARAS